MEDDSGLSKTVHSPIISGLICIGLFANIVFLMSLKADKPNINNSEKIQVYKSCLSILALLSYVPVELWVMQMEAVTSITCRIKDLLQSTFLDTIPIGIFAVAIVRFRLVVFNGDSITHMTRRLRILIIGTCSVVSMTIGLSKFIYGLMSSGEDESSTPQNITISCYEIGPESMRYFNVISSVLMYAIPSLVMTCLYIVVIYISSTSITRVQNYGGQREEVSNGNPSSMDRRGSGSNVFIADPETYSIYIQRFIGTLIVLFLITSVPISTIEIYLSTYYVNGNLYVALLYFKTAMCIFHAVGEGVFCIEKIRRARLFVDRYITRTNTTTQQSMRNSRENRIYSVPVIRTVALLSTLNEMSTPPPSSRNKIHKEKDNHVAPKTKNVQSTSENTNDYIDVFEETNVVQHPYTDGHKNKRSNPNDTISKDQHAVKSIKSNDLSPGETSKTDCFTPRTTQRYRTDSTLKHYSLPGMTSWKRNVSPNRRRSQYFSSVSSVLSDSVFSTDFDHSQQRYSKDDRNCSGLALRARTTSVRTPDFEEICDADRQLRLSIRTLSTISDSLC